MVKWAIDSKECQLCLQQPGTLLHRFCCSKTLERFLATLSPDSRRLLQTRGLLMLKVPIRPWNEDGSFRWLIPPSLNSTACDDATWYFDGSMLYGKWSALRSTGFGIAVISKDGGVLGIGIGIPPSWVTTAAAAEAWALKTVLELSPFIPLMCTDCLGLLQTADQGTERATASNRVLARIWVQIARALDGNIRRLVSRDNLIWLPAHLTLQAVGERKLSNGARMTIIDWRANRLVDALAKMAAAQSRLLPALLALLKTATLAAQYSARLLGRVTFAANNCPMQVQNEDGTLTQVMCRDSQPAPKHRCTKKRRIHDDPKPDKQSEASHSQSANAVQGWTGPRKRRRFANLRASEAERADLKRHFEELSGTLAAAEPTVTAAQRLELVRRRVADRLELSPT